MPIPHLPAGSYLSRVAATSADNAWVVGYTRSFKTLILRWNGTRWRRVAARAVTGVTGGLDGVTAISARDAWAVGFTSNTFMYGCAEPAARLRLPGVGVRVPSTTKQRPLIFHWNGTSWRPVRSTGLRDGQVLFGVTATSTDDAWAVGGLNYIQPNAKVVVLRWNGSIWR
jgi:hypothetical protein